jgi:hypothetical protein
MAKYLRKPLLILCVTALAVGSAHAQYLTRTVLASAGDNYKNSDITLSYVAGEAIGGLLYNTTINPHLYLTTGFEQPDVEVSQVLTNSAISLAVFPNPTNSSTVKLAFNHVPDGVYTINVFDALGKILQSQTVNYKAINYYYFPIDISQYAGGIYFIQVVNPALFHGEVKLVKY